MNQIKDKYKAFHFDKHIYSVPPIFITSEKFWDGGINAWNPLEEKIDFYHMVKKMSDIIKDLIVTFNEKVYIDKSLCEYGEMFAQWSDIKKYELYRNVFEVIKKNKCYEISLPEDNSIIDLIVESNFRYFSYIAFYLSNSNIILQPTCHTEILVYTEYQKAIIENLKTIVAKHSNDAYKIICTYAQDGTAPYVK